MRERVDENGRASADAEIDMFIMIPLGISEFSNGLFNILEHTNEKLKGFFKRLKKAGAHSANFQANYVQEEDDSGHSDI